MLRLKGGLLIRFRGFRHDAPTLDGSTEHPELSRELNAALREKTEPPFRTLWRVIRRDGFLPPATLAAGAAIAALTVMVEGLLLRGLLDLNRFVGVAEQRLGAVAAVITLLAAALLLALPQSATLLRMGRHLEIRLRAAFLAKIPRLADRYLHSRLSSDMVERAHAIHTLRTFPAAIGRLYRLICLVLATVAGIIWLDPPSAPAAIIAAATAIGLPLISQQLLVEKDLKARTHTGALSRFFLDALLGLTTVRAHSAEKAVRREHETMLLEWFRSNLAVLNTAVRIQGVVTLCGFLAAIWVLADHLSRGGESGMVLLLVYWVLTLPALGQEISLTARSLPSLRNTSLRLTEPLGAPDETAPVPADESTPKTTEAAAAITFDNVSVRAGGHTILEDINLEIPAGTHLAVVGPSGAGKSSLVGLLLGWHRPAQGSVSVDGETLDGATLQRLRRHTAWVDPEVHIWNRPLVDNLHYGCTDQSCITTPDTLKRTGLYEVVERLPLGLQTELGEGGGLLSGGEGQRVRLGRGFNRPDARLVILDEPFRGLDRGQRRALLEQSRTRFSDATLVCVTHDIRETEMFDQVVVIAEGRLVEHGRPEALKTRATGAYRRLLDAEEDLQNTLWGNPEWRRLNLSDGTLKEEPFGGGR